MYCERLTLPVANLHLVPDNVSTENAAFAEPLAAAFRITEQGLIQPTDRVAVVGDGKLGILIAEVVGRHIAKTPGGTKPVLFGRHQDKMDLVTADAQIETMWSCSGGAGKSMSETSLQQLAPAGEEGGAPVSELLGGGGGGGPQQTPPPPGGLRTDLPTGVPDLPTDVWAATVDAGAGERVQLVNASTLQRAAGGVPVCNLPTTGAQPPAAR